MSHLKLVVDNTNIVPKQPFSEPVVTTRDEMVELRSGFDQWMEGQSIKLGEELKPIIGRLDCGRSVFGEDRE